MRAWLLVIAGCGRSAATPVAPVAPVSEPASVEATPVEATPVPVTPVDTEDAKRASAEFLGQVRDSAGAIKGCWNSAQSAYPELRTKQIQLSITAELDPSGLVQLSLAPMVTESFAECVKQRAAGWKVALTRRMTFRASLTLAP